MISYDCPLAFILDAEPPEISSRLRELRVITAMRCGWQSGVKLAFDEAIADPSKAKDAIARLDALPPLLRRHVLADFGAAVFGPVRKRGRKDFRPPQ